MSDQDVRKGYRAMVSGGAVGLGNEEVANLSNALAQTQRERGITPSVDEVSYLQEFVKINEEYIRSGVSNGYFDATSAQSKLDELNEKFSSVSESVRRTEIIAPSMESDLSNEGWMSSSYSC